MKHFTIPLIFTILLSGCTREAPVSETIADNAINATTALEQTLAPECKTDGIKTQLAVIKTEIRATKNACQAEKEQITREMLKWKWLFWGLVTAIGVFVVRKVLK